MQLTYSLVEPLIVDTHVEGGVVSFLFRCPATGRLEESWTSLSQASEPPVAYTERSKLGEFLRWSLGYGEGEGQAREPASTDATLHQTAAVMAFRKIQNRYAWDQSGHRFVALKAMESLQTEFSQLLMHAPVTDPWDQSVLARMITEVAAADGVVVDAERPFFHAFVTPGTGTLEELLGQPPLSPRDLSRTTPASRDSMLAVASAVAYSDFDLNPREIHGLQGYASGLGIEEKRADLLMRWAREHLVDQLLESDYLQGQLDGKQRREAWRIAASLGVTRTRFRAIEVRCRSRRGD